MNVEKMVKLVNDLLGVWYKAGSNPSQCLGIVLYVMCLKKMIEENACKNADHMNTVLAITKILYRPTSFDDIDILRKGADVLEETYDLEQGLLHDVLYTSRYQEELWKKAVLNTVEIVSQMEINEAAAEFFVYKISKEYGNEYTSPHTVAELLAIGANVKDGDSVLDGTVGNGYSALECIRGKQVSFCGVDVRTEAIRNTAMYLILSDKKDFQLMNEDFTAINTAGLYDKVVMDIPFGLKTDKLVGFQTVRAHNWMDNVSCKEMECLFLAEGLDSLKDHGRMVVIVPQGFLFKQSKGLSAFRKNVVQRGMLKAVVALPPVYNYTTINTAMLVFESGNEDVLFVDATKLIERERRLDPIFRPDNKMLLHEILEEKKTVVNISFTVPKDEVLKVADWSIGKYQTRVTAPAYRSLTEINQELSECYKKLDGLNDRNNRLELFR